MTAPMRAPAACDRPGDDHLVTRAGRKDVGAVANVLADAFDGYPWTDWVVPEHHRRQRLRRLHGISLSEVALPYGAVWLASCPGTGETVGAMAVLRPDRPIPTQVWSNLAAHEAKILGDRREAAAGADAVVADLRPQEPAVVVATLAVERHHRRRGLARRLLLHALSLADDLGVPAYLETSTAGNVELYRSVGFEVSAHRRVAGGGPDVWAMRRLPSAQRSAQP